jgi:hypothetical protein
LQDPPKFTQIGIFGLKIYHLATLILVCRRIPQKLALYQAYWNGRGAFQISVDVVQEGKIVALPTQSLAFELLVQDDPIDFPDKNKV